MKKIFIINILAAILLFSSCDSWIDGVAKEIELPTIEPAMAPFLFIDSRDTAITVNISQTTGVLTQDQPIIIKNATIEVLKDGNVIHTLDESHYNEFDQNYRLSLGEAFGGDNESGLYEMRVNAAGFDEITASQNMPKPIAIDSVRYTPNGFNNAIDGNLAELKLHFQDPSDEENYYMAVLLIESLDTFPDGTPQYVYTGWMQSQETFIEDGWNGPIFSDASFNGSYMSISFGTWIDDFSFDYENYKFRLLSISKDSYTYLKSIGTYFNSSGNPFAEPSLLHSNTENGFGFFGLTTGSEKEIIR